MASRKKKTDVDGFSVIKAAQQAAQSGKSGDAAAKNKKEDASSLKKQPPGGADPPTSDSAKNPYAKAKRTAMPTVRELICYECGTSLEIKGAMSNTVCHKCRARLEIKDHVIKDGPWSDEILTAGSVTIEADAEIQDGASIVANNVILKGEITGGLVRASRSVTLATEDPVDFGFIETLDLAIPKDLCIDLGDEEMKFRHVEVAGELSGKLKLSGVLRIAAGGYFVGGVSGPHLEVADGGGLNAELNIRGGSPWDGKVKAK